MTEGTYPRMSFLTLPPEINSLRMFAGAGVAAMVAAASAWGTLGDELVSAAASRAQSLQPMPRLPVSCAQLVLR